VSIELWVDRYIPQTLDEYVWRDPAMRRKFEEYLSDGAMPHLLLSGRAGLGKTSLLKLMLRLLGVPEGDILIIKASNERKVEEVQARIMGFVQTYPMIENEHGIKYILLDEADSLSQLSQRFLRSEMESFSATSRFILTCNYPQKIEPAILSRCQQFHFEALDMESFIVRVSSVLDTERVSYDLDHLVEYIDVAYPDLRKCIGLVQLNTVAGELQPKPKESKASLDWMLDAVSLFQKNQHTAARKMIIAQATVEEYPDVFRFLYQNLELFGATQDQQDDALVIVRDGLYKHSFVADPEINLSATIVECCRLNRK
jgi:DNA polymerase III delta prime subunit